MKLPFPFPFRRFSAAVFSIVFLLLTLFVLNSHADTYSAWTARVFTPAEQADMAVSGETAAPAGDGIPNLMKYAFGINPHLTGTPLLPKAGFIAWDGEQYFTISYQTSADNPPADIYYMPEVSTDLKNWSHGNAVLALYDVEPFVGADGANYETFTYASLAPVSQTPTLFARISVLDGENIPDAWLLLYFGTTAVDPNALAANGSGLTNFQCCLQGIDPTAGGSGGSGGSGSGGGSDGSGNLTWAGAETGGYGAVPGATAPRLSSASSLLAATIWRGHYLDATGFYNLGARVYGPQSGRFLSPDPLGHGSSLSLYDYANGDPVNELDPDGRFGKNPGASAASYSTLGYGSQAEMDYANVRMAGMSGYDLQEMTYGAPTAGAVLRATVSLVANVAVSPVTSVGMDISEAAFGVGAGNMPVSGWARLGAGASLALDVLPIIDEAKLGTTALRGAAEGLDAVDVGASAAKSTALKKFYPDDNGFVGETAETFLYKGQKIDRYGGYDKSRFFSPQGTPDFARALPPGTAAQQLRTFEVMKPFPVQSGQIAPAFGQIGGGTQMVSPLNLKTLLEKGILKEVTR